MFWWLRRIARYFSVFVWCALMSSTSSSALGMIRKCFCTSQEDIDGLLSIKGIHLFTYKEIKLATNNFDRSNKLGRGGFGTVYKGIFGDGTVFAAKVLSDESDQGIREFLTEIKSISDVKHANLVRLLGCCVQRKNRILIYEHVENNSLDQALKALGSSSGETNLTWSIRSGICVGTAKGLNYLHEEHEPHIVHRDIKASNILLDRNFSPKIGDFGLAKLFPANVTHISTRVVGTTGYLAPEYAVNGQLTKKADVYSFGVLVLEIISGRRISQTIRSDMFLVHQAWQLYQQNNVLDIVDAKLKEYPEEEVLRHIKVGLICTQAPPCKRPTMRQVVKMLSGPVILDDDVELCPPVFADHYTRTFGRGYGSSTHAGVKCAMLTSASVTYSEVVPR